MRLVKNTNFGNSTRPNGDMNEDFIENDIFQEVVQIPQRRRDLETPLPPVMMGCTTKRAKKSTWAA